MLGILKGDRGLAPAILILVVVWALAAVLMLTGTLVAAGQIDDSVAIIKPEVSDIGTDTEAIALAAKTNQLTIQIRRAAAPLTGLADDTLEAANGIDKTAKSILRKAGTINGTVLDINQNVGLIGQTVSSIGSNVSGIAGSVGSIGGSARSISASVNSINGNTRSINAAARGINAKGGTILSEVKEIDPSVSGINNRAVVIQGVARDLGADLAKVQRLVGRQNSDANTILNHANSIDCSNLLQATNTELVKALGTLLSPLSTLLSPGAGTPSTAARTNNACNQ